MWCSVHHVLQRDGGIREKASKRLFPLLSLFFISLYNNEFSFMIYYHLIHLKIKNFNHIFRFDTIHYCEECSSCLVDGLSYNSKNLLAHRYALFSLSRLPQSVVACNLANLAFIFQNRSEQLLAEILRRTAKDQTTLGVFSVIPTTMGLLE